MKTFKQYILENQQEPVIDDLGTKRWYNEKGEGHRDGDLPAIEYTDGTKMWLRNGRFYREQDKPAIEWSNGSKEWFKDGERHRETGPAVIYPREWKSVYYLNGRRYTKEEFEAELRRRKMLDTYKRGDTDRNVTNDLEDIGHII